MYGLPSMKAGSGSKGVLEDERLVPDAGSFYVALSELIRVYQFRDRDPQ